MKPFPWTWANRSPSFLRLLVLYSLAVLLAAVTISGVSLVVFQDRYRAQVADLHRMTVSQLAHAVQTRITDRALAIYMEIASQLITPTPLFFGVDDPAGAAVKIQQTHQVLTALLNRNIDVVEAIHVSYPRAGLTLSTRWGLDSGSDGGSLGTSWLADLRAQSRDSLWTTEPSGTLRLRQTFPLLLDPAEATALVTVDFRSGVLGAVVQEFARLDGAQIEVVGKEGHPVFSTGPARVDSEVLETRLPLDSTDWTLVDRAPLAQLYEKDDPLRLALVLVSLGIIGVGVVLGAYLSVRLSARMEQLSATVETSGPLVKADLAARLLEGDALGSGEVAETLVLVGAGVFPPVCRALRATWTLGGGWGTQEARVLKYGLAESLERTLPGFVLPTVLGGTTLGAVVGDDNVVEILERWAVRAGETWGCALTVCLGGAVSGPDEVPRSFLEAEALGPWAWIFPETRIFVGRSDLLTRKGVPGGFPGGGPEAFSQALRLRREGEAFEALDRLRIDIRTGEASLDQCRTALAGISRALADWSADLKVEESPSPVPLPAQASDLDAFLEAVRAATADRLRRVDDRRHDRNSVLVQRILAYVDGHLGDDLSLDRVGAEVGLSAGYLSTVFKETTGNSFLASVTERRMEAGRQLLETTRGSVKDISHRVGFQTPAYFIRQFKVRYGRTPAEFRRGS